MNKINTMDNGICFETKRLLGVLSSRGREGNIMNAVFLLASVFIMVCAITFFAIFATKEKWFWSGMVGAVFLIGLLLFAMAIQAWRAPAMDHKAQLTRSGMSFMDGVRPYTDCNMKLIQRRIVIKDAMDYTYWEVAD